MNKSKNILKGEVKVPGDKSVSHRALIFSAFSKGTNKVWNLSPAHDVNSTMNCLMSLGLRIRQNFTDKNGLSVACHVIESSGIKNLIQPSETLFAGNSGTTIRLLSGLVAGSHFTCNFDGDQSLRGRPMARVLGLLQKMGALVKYTNKDNYAPFEIKGALLQGQKFELSIASAQVETALLLAGLQAEGETTVAMPTLARDHTQRLFKHIHIPFKGLALKQKNTFATSVTKLTEDINPFEIKVPGDISSAAFFMVAAALLKGSEVNLIDVGMNPGRTLIIDVLKRMGANISIDNQREESGELIADIRVKGDSILRATTIKGNEIASGIDELPILALAGAFSEGLFVVRDAHELRLKESDRILAIVNNLKAIGAEINEVEDGFDIKGKTQLAGGCKWKSYGDHRLAMTGLIANLLCEKAVNVDDVDCVSVSYPQFVRDLEQCLSS